MTAITPGTPRRDRGETVTQLVLLVPAMLLVLLLGIQASIWYHAANVASAAAAQGAAAAAPSDVPAATGGATARQTVIALGGRLIGEPAASRGLDRVTVTVRVAVPRVVPFFPSSVQRTAVEPLERFVPETER